MPRERHLHLAARASICALLLAVAIAAGAGGEEEVGALYARARERLAAGDAAGALELLERAIALSPASAGPRELRGWALLRLGRSADAEGSFRAALERSPGTAGALSGLGYALLQRGDAEQALRKLDAALAADPANGDAARGRVRALMRLARWDEAGAALGPLREAAPGDGELAELAATIAEAPPGRETRPHPPVPAAQPLRVVARAGRSYLEIGPPPGRRPIFVKGVNLGVALPGRFPTEFPRDAELYRDWLAAMAEMNANAVRLYTLLPPAFYAALAQHNRRHADRPLWLLQGVWVELPPGHDFEDEGFKAGFRREIERVLDAIHGNLDLPPRPGHASGRYRDDVSGWVLGLILGREWEPFSVVAHNELHPGERAYRGRFARLDSGSAMEAWLAWVLDTAVAYETDRYRVQRPAAFSNWPTLDPLAHPTESSRAEENAIRRARGEEVRERKVPQYNDDEVAVDAERIVPTEANRAGFFASYHVYPYHPDFMILDPELQKARDAQGPSPYYGYLRDLKRHHGSQPLLVSELGVPTSRGVAHVHPLGWSHGGQSERQQGERIARMMSGVHEAGCAGGVLFAWIDEWFKRTWITSPLEIPAERDPLWHNLMDPEESFGILAARAGPASGGHRLDGDAAEWDGIDGVLRRRFAASHGGCGGPARLLQAAASADAAWLHLLLEVDGAGCGGDGEFDWDGLALLVGIDTHGDRRGDRRLRPDDRRLLPTGVEFRVRLRGPGRSDVQVDPSYDVGSSAAEGPFVSVPNDDGRFTPLTRETNRRRIGRDGTEYPRIVVDQSPLRFLSELPGSPGRADAAAAAHGQVGVVELRLPWGLLNFTDPSSHRILDQPARHPPPFDSSTTDRVLFHLSLRDAGGAEIDARTLGPFLWERWDVPLAHVTPKASYALVQRAFAALPDEPGAPR